MDLLSDIEKQLQKATAQAFLIALSGGLDSTVLLSLFAKLCQKQPHLQILSLRAIHIHHGLSPMPTVGLNIAKTYAINFKFH